MMRPIDPKTPQADLDIDEVDMSLREPCAEGSSITPKKDTLLYVRDVGMPEEVCFGEDSND